MLDEAGQYLPDAAVALISRAHDFAASAHRGQMRKSGEPYLVHLIATAYYLAGLRLDVTSIVAGLLHDTIEDTDVAYDDLEREFGHAVARIVEGVSKFGEIGHRHRLWGADGPEADDRRQRTDRARQQAENVRKMFLAMAEDPRVVIVKLADRLHNMRTLDFQPPEKQRRIALDTREIYAPLAGRLGIATIKTPLEDLAFKYLEPEAYRWLVEQLAEERTGREAYIRRMSELLQAQLAAHGIDAEVTGRAKHLYSIYKKLIRPDVNMDLSRVYDLFALRVVVESVPECYQVLGLVHSLWLPVPGRVKDYIARAKSNGYQSLHTSVVTEDQRTTEVQIRTREMHEIAEFGVATHWYYKEQGRSASLPQPLADWIQQLIAWQNELNPDAAEFVDTLKTDVFSGQVFVVSPRGDIIDLPRGSTPIDFAYRIHTELGHRTIGAKVNGLMVPLDSELQTGDRVDILTTKTAHGPGRDWLSFARSANARQKIRQWFKKQDREENIARGREILETELRKLGSGSLSDLGQEALADVAAQLSLKGPDDVFAQLGYGALTTHQILNRLGVLGEQEDEIPAVAPPAPPPSGQVRVMGCGNLLTRMASDCNPAPGDEIIGYITRGRGVTVHRADCPRILAEKEQERLVHVDWGPRNEQQVYPVSIVVDAWDRDGLLRDITTAVAEERVSLASARADTSPDGKAVITATLRIAGIDQLSRIFTRVERVKGVLEVRRQGHRQGNRVASL
ncbi:MAG: bifunctional (p)ppGpp synthetase/guanosine-3',5'-bis(diphosphate) 3'-pyrophosphohydrolase [Chloroflexi bacterium]|nr:bifunctional (p)ppGpp synthetase/guanosine-3',5'-bis(diphosphate) 3'-pyrophosphohydrolase [Chloroflexota bacterium]